MDPNSREAHEYAAAAERLIAEGRLPRPQAQTAGPTQPVPRRTKVLTPRFAGPVYPEAPRFTGLPKRIEVPPDLQFVINRRFYRDLEYICGCLYAGIGPINGLFGWQLCPRNITTQNHRLWVGTWG
jgi:hypothetical protein